MTSSLFLLIQCISISIYCKICSTAMQPQLWDETRCRCEISQPDFHRNSDFFCINSATRHGGDKSHGSIPPTQLQAVLNIFNLCVTKTHKTLTRMYASIGFWGGCNPSKSDWGVFVPNLPLWATWEALPQIFHWELCPLHGIQHPNPNSASPFSRCLTLWRQLLSYEYSYKASCAWPG